MVENDEKCEMLKGIKKEILEIHKEFSNKLENLYKKVILLEK